MCKNRKHALKAAASVKASIRQQTVSFKTLLCFAINCAIIYYGIQCN